MHPQDEIIKDTNRVEIVQTQLQRLESSRGLQDLLGREKDAIRTQQAARMLELEKKLAEYREKYGVFPGGEKAAREVLLSKKSGANEKISQTVRTILETKATPEEMVPDIMELAMEGKYSCEEASREVVADACEMMLGNSTVVEQLAKENCSLAEKIRDWLREWVENLKIALEGLQADRTESRAMMQYAQELQEIWDNALMDAARNNRGNESKAKFSVRTIIGEDGKNYGIGVCLDSELLTNLTASERIQMVKERVKELGGRSFIAYDMDGSAVEIRIADAKEHFVNRRGRRVAVNKDLATKNNKKEIKQETVVLADEVISTSKSSGAGTEARYPHGWLDNNGANDWTKRIAYLQDKNNTVWEATLHIATSTDGVKYLYDISPIKKVGQSRGLDTSTTKVERPGKSGTTSTANSIRSLTTNSQEKSSDNKTPTADPDIRYQQRDSDKTGDWDENGNPIFDNTPVRVEEATDFAEVKRRRKAAVEDYGLEKMSRCE